jgi:hypothetical protein
MEIGERKFYQRWWFLFIVSVLILLIWFKVNAADELLKTSLGLFLAVLYIPVAMIIALAFLSIFFYKKKKEKQEEFWSWYLSRWYVYLIAMGLSWLVSFFAIFEAIDLGL